MTNNGVRMFWLYITTGSALLSGCGIVGNNLDDTTDTGTNTVNDDHANTDGDADMDTDMDADGDSDGDTDTDSDMDTDTNTDTDSDMDTDTDTDSDMDTDTDTDADSNTDMDTDGDIDQFCQYKDTSTICESMATDGVLRITNEDNYYFRSTIDVTATVVKGLSNLTFRWDGLTRDLFGRPMDPAVDIDLMLVSLWESDQVSLSDNINRGILQMSTNNGTFWELTEGEQIQTQLFDMGIMGETTPSEQLLPFVDDTSTHYDPAQWTHMVIAQSGTIPGSNVRMLKYFTLGETENTEINLTPESSVLTYQANIRNQNWLAVPTGKSDLTINWELMQTNVAGTSFVPTRISRVVVAQYTMNRCEIENNFLLLEDIADAWYEKSLEMISTDFLLSTLEDADGNPFPGIDNTGTWLVALRCDTCVTAVPWFLTVLYPC